MIDLEHDVVTGGSDLGLGGRKHGGGAVAALLSGGQHGLGRGSIEVAVGVGQAVREIAAVLLLEELGKTSSVSVITGATHCSK